MTHHELDHLDQTQRRLFLEAVERGEPIEKATERIKRETMPEFRRILEESGTGVECSHELQPPRPSLSRK